MAIFKINGRTKIYIHAPYQFGGGGGEALHQLAHKLGLIRKNVFVIYRDTLHGRIRQGGRPASFHMYNVVEATSIEDNPDNILITPEVWTQDIERMFPEIQIGIWWLSVTNNANSGEGRFTNWTDMRMSHLCQSIYAQNFVAEHGRSSELLFDYLDLPSCIGTYRHKEDTLCYNPAKGANITSQIISGLRVGAVALQNMSRMVLVEKLRECKIYIDFGHHPGMDRLPREAVLNDCIVIVGRNGSANTDIPIPEMYKFHNHETGHIQERIYDCMINYDRRILDFGPYKQSQIALERTYESQIRSIFT